jgi:SAM-dependent methyltransferase
VDQDDGVGGARYDEHAAWYDKRVQGEQHPTDCVVCAAILDLDDGRAGVLADIGCAGAAHRRALLRSGRAVVGFDISFEQVRIAHPRLDAAAVSDGCRLPLRDEQVDVVNLTFVHSDVPGPSALLREAVRVVTPSGQLILVGPHPCFNGPCFERSADGRFIVHPVYSQSGWYEDAPGFGDGVRRRVGFHHRTLSQLFNDLLVTGLTIRRVVEYGEDPPFILGISAVRPYAREA